MSAQEHTFTFCQIFVISGGNYTLITCIQYTTTWCVSLDIAYILDLSLVSVILVEQIRFIKMLTLWQAERHFCHLRFTGAATILSFFRSILLAWILLTKLSVNVQ